MKRALLLVALCACNGVSTHPLAADGPESDAPPLDGPPTYARHYVIDQLLYPTTSVEARSWGFDFDDDQSGDNQLGAMFAIFPTVGLDPQARSDYAVSHGSIILLAELASQDPAFGDGPATFELFTGENPDPEPCSIVNSLTSDNCGRHLQGTGSFDISPASADHPPLVGTLATGMLVSDPGTLAISIAFADIKIPLLLLDARLQLTTTTAVGASGILSGAVTQDDITTQLIPRLADALQAAMKEDCHGGPPDCGCPMGSNGYELWNQFDRNRSCDIVASEVSLNSLVHTAIANDVLINGATPATSFAIRFTAVNATFTP